MTGMKTSTKFTAVGVDVHYVSKQDKKNIVQCSVVGFTPRVLKGVTVKWGGPILQNAVYVMFFM